MVLPFSFVAFILSLLLLLRLCCPLFLNLIFYCSLFLWFTFFFLYINFNFSLLYLSRLVTKGKEEGIINCLVYWYSAKRLSTRKRSYSWKQGTFLFLFSHLSFDNMVLALMWLYNFFFPFSFCLSKCGFNK